MKCPEKASLGKGVGVECPDPLESKSAGWFSAHSGDFRKTFVVCNCIISLVHAGWFCLIRSVKTAADNKDENDADADRCAPSPIDVIVQTVVALHYCALTLTTDCVSRSGFYQL